MDTTPIPLTEDEVAHLIRKSTNGKVRSVDDPWRAAHDHRRQPLGARRDRWTARPQHHHRRQRGDSHPMKTNLKAPCSDCPFRKKSLPGWLGPWQPWDLLRSVDADVPFPCHQTIAEDHEERGQSLDQMQSCAGAALFLANRYKLSRDPSTARHQALLRQQDDYVEQKARVMSTENEFMLWHSADNLRANMEKLMEMQRADADTGTGDQAPSCAESSSAGSAKGIVAGCAGVHDRRTVATD